MHCQWGWLSSFPFLSLVTLTFDRFPSYMRKVIQRLHITETQLVNKQKDMAIQQAEMWMVRWITGVKKQTDCHTVSRQTRYRWYIHISTMKQVETVFARFMKRCNWLVKMYGLWSAAAGCNGWSKKRRHDGTTGHLEVDTPRATVPSLSTCDGHTTRHRPMALF